MLGAALAMRAHPHLQRLIRAGVALALLAYAVAAYRAQWQRLSPATGLPLHLCDLVLVLLLWAQVQPRPRLIEVVYYWGLAGAIPAELSPDLLVGYPSWDFFQFFLGHTLIVVGVLAALQAGPTRPRPHSHRVAFGYLLVYVGVIGALDHWTGWNYGYLCAPPAGATVVDRFGGWPTYVLVGLLLAWVLFWVLARPWNRKPADQSGKIA